jgi:hypothetical protein
MLKRWMIRRMKIASLEIARPRAVAPRAGRLTNAAIDRIIAVKNGAGIVPRAFF